MKRIFDIPEEKRIKLGELVKRLRLEKNYGMNQFALKVGINISDIHKIENAQKKKINPYQLRLIGEGLKIDYRDLYKIVGYLDEEETSGKTGIESNMDLSTGFKEVPVYQSISAGLGLEEAQPGEVEFIVLPNTKEFRGDVVGIRVNGDSMEYTIENGSVAFIKKGEEVQNKKVGAFILNNRPLLKRYMCQDDDCFLRSDNREYSDIKVGEDDDFHIVGKYIGNINIDG